MNYNKINYYVGLGILLCSSLVYLITMHPTISFWNSGEFAACAQTLSIPHSPGAPLWILIAKAASLFPFGSNPAVRINAVSAISSGFTVFFLYLVIVISIKNWRGDVKNNWEAVIVFGSAGIGALSYAFCDSFWFNASTSDVYGFGTMIISLCVWLLFYWWQKADTKGSDRILLLVGFIIGLGLGIYLLVVQIILVLGFLYYFRKFEYSRKSFLIAFLITCGIFLIVYPVMVLWYPTWLSGNINILKITNNSVVKWLSISVIPVIIFLIFYYGRKGKKTLALTFTFLILVIAGYSMYTSVILRAHVENLPVNENSPLNMNTLASYLNNEQYIDAPFFPRRYSGEQMHKKNMTNYSGDLDFLWRYQINHMFTRYLGWQYIGRAGYEQDKGIDWSKFYGIPLLIGLFGLFYHFRKDWKFGATFLWMFLLMGVFTALYQRQQDPQPRERDYIYAGAYFVYSLWIGIGVMGILELIKEAIKNQKAYQYAGVIVLVFALIFIPANMFRVNVHYQNKANNYVPFDFAYNLLQSVDKDGILFTNGDNDTFPLWYLQSIGYRQDVRIINISLLNDDWYIKELKNSTPYGSMKVPFNLTDDQIALIHPIQWGESKIISLQVPQDAFSDSLKDNFNIPDKITWKMQATMNSENSNKAVKKSDLIMLEIIKSSNWKRPIYFSSNIPDDNCIGLSEYLVNEGMAKKLVPFKDVSGKQFRVDDNMYENLMKTPDSYSKTPAPGFYFRGLDNKSTFFDQIESNSIQNYRTQYLTLAYSYYGEDSIKVREVLDKMEKNLPRSVIPMDYRIQHDAAMLYSRIGENQKFLELSKDVETRALEELKKDPNDIQTPWNPYKLLLDIYETKGEYKNALDILSKLDMVSPGSPEVKMKIDAIKSKIEGNNN